jgi:hypothetical protein
LPHLCRSLIVNISVTLCAESVVCQLVGPRDTAVSTADNMLLLSFVVPESEIRT